MGDGEFFGRVVGEPLKRATGRHLSDSVFERAREIGSERSARSKGLRTSPATPARASCSSSADCVSTTNHDTHHLQREARMM